MPPQFGFATLRIPHDSTSTKGYYPHPGDAGQARPWLQSYAFNQPLIPVWRSPDGFTIGLPFWNAALARSPGSYSPALPPSLSLASAEGGMIVDLVPQDGQVHALVVDYGGVPATLRTPAGALTPPAGWLSDVPVQLK